MNETVDRASEQTVYGALFSDLKLRSEAHEEGAAASRTKGAAYMRDDETPLTLSVPEAGKKYYGLSRDGSYDAAQRGLSAQGWSAAICRHRVGAGPVISAMPSSTTPG